MNAAAKAINQGNFFTWQWRDLHLSMSAFFQAGLLMAVLTSALAVVYTTNLHRVTFSQLESAEQQANELRLQWGQLLLEQASLVTPARVQQLAEKQLGMVLPSNKQALILRVR